LELGVQPLNQVEAVLCLDSAADVATGEQSIIFGGSLFLKKGHQAGDQCPKA
jgi:hypothetical protein